MKRRQAVLSLLLGLAITASVWMAQQEEPELVTARPGSQANQDALHPPSAAGEQALPVLIRAQALAWPAPEAASLAAWTPASPPTPAPPPRHAEPEAPPPPPQAPAFPYQLIGRLEEAGVTQAMLNGPLRAITARSGDLIDGQWRLDRMESNRLHLTWLPGNLTLTLGYATP